MYITCKETVVKIITIEVDEEVTNEEAEQYRDSIYKEVNDDGWDNEIVLETHFEVSD